MKRLFPFFYLSYYRPLFLPSILGLLVLLSLPASAQTDSLATFDRICTQYLVEENRMIADTSYLPDAAGKVLSPRMAEYLRKRFLYNYTLGRPTVIHPERKAVPLITDSLVACQLTFPGTADVLLNLEETEAGWRIVGVNGEIIDEAQIRYTDSLLSAARLIAAKKEDIRSFLRQFIQAANGFWAGGKVDSLRPFCTAGYLEILTIGRKADSLAEAHRLPWTLKSQYIDWGGGDTAIAQLKVGAPSPVVLYLIRSGEQWRVFGERGLIGDAENIAIKRQELDQVSQKAKLRDALQQELNPALIAFFERGQEDSLRARSSPQFFSSMEKIKMKFGQINPNYLKVEGMSFPVNIEAKVELKGDEARVFRHDDTVLFSQKGGEWYFSGYNQFVERAIPEAYIETNYERLLFFWGVDYSAFNDESQPPYLPAPGAEDTMTYHYMAGFMLFEATPRVSGGLWKYMEEQMQTRKRHAKKQPSYAYLSFYIEKDGRLSKAAGAEKPG
jgi:hypothetical protein